MTDHETAHNNNVDDHDNVEEVSPAYDKAENKTTSKQDREQWEKNVKDRLEKASGQLQHDEKRSMQLGGAALVLAAVGGALLVRAVADPGRVIEFGRTTLLAASIFFR